VNTQATGNKNDNDFLNHDGIDIGLPGKNHANNALKTKTTGAEEHTPTRKMSKAAGGKHIANSDEEVEFNSGDEYQVDDGDGTGRIAVDDK
jgi:hypothetical protein